MAWSSRTVHPLIRFLTVEGEYGPLPLGLSMLFYTLYGQWRRANSPQAYAQRNLDTLAKNLQISTQRWREFLAASPRVADWADRGRLFNSPGDWPDRWPPDWPTWVRPTYLHRAFGGTNRLASTFNGRMLKKWTSRDGMPEVFAYVAGAPLTREQTSRAYRGARALLQTPQFLTWAYNVPVQNYPRTDISPFVSAPALHRLTVDPLSVEDEHVLVALPPWLLDPSALIARSQPFNPLRTQAPDYVRYPNDNLLGRKGRHLDPLPPPVPLLKKTGYRPTWPKNKVPLYLTAR